MLSLSMENVIEAEVNASSPVVFPAYFIESFNFIIEHISSDANFSILFDESDWKYLTSFNQLCEDSQKLYLTLFRRSKPLFRLATLRVDLVSQNLNMLFEKLVAQEFLSMDVTHFSEVELLSLLDRKEINDLATLFKLPTKGTKKDLMNCLLKSARAPSLMSFFAPKVAKESRLRHLTLKSLGSCYSLNVKSVEVFSRCILIFSLAADKGGPITSNVSFTSHLSSELYELLQMRRGDVIYPNFTISRRLPIFRDREELRRFTELYALKHRLECLKFISDFEQAFDVFKKHEDQILSILKDSKYLRPDIPTFLHRFSLPYIACRLVCIAISICERLRLYSKAVTLIKVIIVPPVPTRKRSRNSVPLSSSCLTQNPLLTLIRSRAACGLLVRYMIDEGTHEGKMEACLETLSQIITANVGATPNDITAPFLRGGHRLEIQRQIVRLLEKKQAKSKKMKKKDQFGSERISKLQCLVEGLHPPLVSASLVKLAAPVNGSSADLGNHRPLYLWTEYSKEEADVENWKDSRIELSSTLLTVEDWALRHYMQNLGFEKGFHCESRVYTTMFLVLFYDILFPLDEGREGVFVSLRQTAPLDLFSDEFYTNRRPLIEARLNLISNAHRFTSSEIIVSETPNSYNVDDFDAMFMDPVSRMITEVWNEHKGEQCIGASWDLFATSQDLVDLFWCLSPRLVSSFCRLLAQDWQNWHSGLPDLCVWGQSKAKLVEIKGPGDTLSCQQMVWIDKLVSFGADVELCSVTAVSRNSLNVRRN